jgi:hypothetical protein
MSNRLLRDGVCTSDTINFLSAEAEVLFYRLLVVADDFGYVDARIPILKARCFPLKESAIPAKIEAWLLDLSTHGLIQRYEKDEKPYLAIAKWEQRQRSRPKYPGPADDGCLPTVGQLPDKGQTDVGLGKGRGKGRGAAKMPLPDDWVPSPKTVEKLGREFGLRIPEDVDRYVDWFRDQCKAKGYENLDFEASFRNCVRSDWPKFRGGKPKLVETEKRVAL